MGSVVVGDQRPLDGFGGGPVVPDGGGHGQQPLGDAGVEAPGGAGAVAFQAELPFEVGDTLQGYSRWLPAEVEITNPRYPLAGQRVPVVSGYRWRGRAWLTVTFPDGHPARIPVRDTDLAGAQVAWTGTTVLSVPGIRRLHDPVRGRAAAPAGECPARSRAASPGREGRRGAGGGTHIGSPPGTAANESRR